MRLTGQSLLGAIALACLTSCNGQFYGAYAPAYGGFYTTSSPGSARRLQQDSFSPFDTASKPYGYGPGINGRHLLENKRHLPAAAAGGRSLMQAYSPLAYAADSLGLDYTEGSARKRALLQADGGALTPQPYGPRPGSYGGYGYAPRPRLLQDISTGTIGDAAVSYPGPAYAAYGGQYSFGAYRHYSTPYGGF